MAGRELVLSGGLSGLFPRRGMTQRLRAMDVSTHRSGSSQGTTGDSRPRPPALGLKAGPA